MKTFAAEEKALMEAALAYPETHEDNPWGHRVAKVKGKAFLFLGNEDGVLSLSVKLPTSGGMALSLPFAEPTGYGLGKSGWVSASFRSGQQVPVTLLLQWLEESFQAVAPKRLLRAYLEARAGAASVAAVKPAAKKAATKKAGTKKAATKKAVAKKPAAKKPAAKKAPAAKRGAGVRLRSNG